MDTETYKLADAGSYDDVTDSFEALTERFTRPIAARLVDLADIRPGSRVLDIGCGTGVVTRLASQRVGAAGHVTGIDLSEGMLRKARELLKADGFEDRTTLQRGDAEALQLADASADSVVSLYALRHFPDPLRALQEMRRVARRGGIVAVAVGSAPPFATVAFVKAAFRKANEQLQAWAGRGSLYATAFLDALLDDFLPAATRDHVSAWQEHHEHSHSRTQASVPALLRQAGFDQVRSSWVGQSSTIATPEEFWTLQVTLSSGARKRLAAASEQDRQRLRSRFDTLCARHLERGGSMRYRSGALIATGVNPA